MKRLITERLSSGKWRGTTRFLLGLAFPLALYYGLRAVGVGTYPALIVGAALPACGMAVDLIRHRKPDGTTAFFNIVTLVALGVSLLGGGQRFLLARGGWTMGLVGLWFIGSIWTGNPLALRFSRPLLEGLLGQGVGRWDLLWEHEPHFRHIWRVASVIFGVGTLGDAGARILMAYTLPIDLVPALSTALYAATSITLLVLVNIYYTYSGLWPLLWGKKPSAAHTATPRGEARTSDIGAEQ